jgi:hypothetical protein
VKSFARTDGFREPKKQKDGCKCCDPGYHKVKLYIGEHVHVPGGAPVDLGQDYHWIREDSNGRWSQKHGLTAVGAQVDDPDADAAAWGYTTKCGDMCAPDQ